MTRRLESTVRGGRGSSSSSSMRAPEKTSRSRDAVLEPHTHLVPAGYGYAFEVKKGEHLRIVDLHGKQVVDFAAWALPDMKEKLSMAYTRMRLAGATPMVGECLLTNKDEPIFRLVADTVKVHDMTFPSCFPEMYEKLGRKGHRSCATNFAQVMRPYGMKTYLEVTDPFNIFQNTPNYTLKALNSSRAGDYIQLEVLKDAVCAVSCCPYDVDGFNGGTVTDIAVLTKLAHDDKAAWTTAYPIRDAETCPV